MACTEHCKEHLDVTIEKASLTFAFYWYSFGAHTHTHKGGTTGLAKFALWPSRYSLMVLLLFLSLYHFCSLVFVRVMSKLKINFLFAVFVFFQGQSAIEFVPVNDGSFQFPLPEFITEEGRSWVYYGTN